MLALELSGDSLFIVCENGRQNEKERFSSTFFLCHIPMFRKYIIL